MSELEFGYGLPYQRLCLFNRALKASACSVEMPAAVEILFCKLVAREVIHRACAHPHKIVLLGVLSERYAQPQAFYLQGHVNQSFGVALDVMKALKIVARQYEIGSTLLLHNHHFLVKHIADEPHAPLAVVVVNVAVDFVFIDALGKQLAYNEEDLGAC